MQLREATQRAYRWIRHGDRRYGSDASALAASSRAVLNSYAVRKHAVFLRYCGVSMMAAVLDNVLFAMALEFWPWISLCQAFSRVTAGTFQFAMGRRGVFRSRAPMGKAFLKYWAWAATMGVISYLMIQTLLNSPMFEGTFTPITAKITAETLLFFGSFAVQRRFIFAGNQAVPAQR